MTRVAVVVNGPPGSGKSTLAAPLAARLGLPLLSKDVVKETLLDTLGYADREDSRRIGAAAGEVLWTVLAGCPDGAVIDTWLDAQAAEVARAGLERSGVGTVLEVWCTCPPEEAARRYAARRRHPGHHDAALLDGIEDLARRARPLGLGQVLEVDTAAPVDPAELEHRVRTALHA